MSQERHRDPILDPPRRKRGRATAWIVAIAFSTALEAAIGFFVLNEKFNLIPKLYHDEHVNVTLEKLPPPPPPPKKPPPPPPPEKVPPAKLQPRETPPPPIGVTPPPPIPVQQVKKEDRVEYKPPPVITANPPPPPPPHEAVITHPDWTSKPNGDALERYYPPAAKERGTEGHATMECTVTASGTLEGCHIVSESPSGQGFGSATLKLAHLFKMRPQTSDGRAVGGARVTIPVTWRLAGG